MRRSIVSAILFVVAGICYLAAAIKGNIPIYYIFGILLLLFGGLYIKRAITEKKTAEKPNTKNNKLKSPELKSENISETKKNTNKKTNKKRSQK